MLPVTTGTGARSRVGSSGSLGWRLARQAGRPVAAVLAIILVVGGTSFLLHSRISDEQGTGLHVVSSTRRGLAADADGDDVANRLNHLAEGATVNMEQAAGKQAAARVQQLNGGTLFGDKDGVKLGTQLGTQLGKGGEAAGRVHGVEGGTLFGRKEGVKLGSGEQASQVAAKVARQQAIARAQAADPRFKVGQQQQQQRQSVHSRGQRFNAAVANYPPRPEPPVLALEEEEVARRREAVRAAMLHAWRGYEQYAWGHDELCPVSKKGKDGFGGLGATMIDAMDTLHMMGFQKEYEKAAEWVRTQMPLNASFDASVFETIIRVVGGMLAAHDRTGDPVMLERAQQVADRLLPAYDTPTKIPYNIINLATQQAKNPTWNQKASTLAEFGTHQLEFWRLSESTGNSTYTELAENTIRHLNRHWPQQGLMPLFISPATGNFTTRRISFGALGDSYFEYLLKLWLLQGRRDDTYRAMWERAMDEMIEKLVFTSREGLTYIAEFDRGAVKHKFDHLVCFVPGMLALGAHSGAVTGAKAERYVQLAAHLTHTCWQMYHRMPTGLSPEYVTFTAQGMKVGAAYNLLRPEALEAMWYMWRLTHDPRYRTWGWEIFQAFERHCKAEAGYSGVKDVRAAAPIPDDTQQSFFLAETLKYLFLLFSDDSAFDLDAWVLNTEAHPLKVSQPGQQQQQQQQPQQRKRWWWPPGRSKGGIVAGSSGGSSDEHGVAR